MVLERLVEFNNRERNSDDLPPLYAEKPVRYIISLGADGRYLGVLDTADPSSRSTRRGVRRAVPQVQRASGIKPLLLADRADYTFGFTLDESKAARVHNCNLAYNELLGRCVEETQLPDTKAVQTFLRDNAIETLRNDHSADFLNWDLQEVIAFRVEDRFVTDNPVVQEFWAAENSPEGRLMQCVVCNADKVALKRLRGKIKGIPGGQSSGVALISANFKAAESYGLEVSNIAPICQECAEGFTRGINTLLDEDRSSFRTSTGVFVFWTREKTEFDFGNVIERPDPQDVRALLESAYGGRMAEVDATAFYALSLSAAGGRAVVRDWIDTTVSNVKRNLADWFIAQDITMLNAEGRQYYGLKALAGATRCELKDVPAPTIPTLLRAALMSLELPHTLLEQVIRRNRAERNVTRPRAAFIKLILMGRIEERKEGYMVKLDKDNDNPAYLCGRLMFTLENAQRAAIPGIEQRTLTNSYYGSASTAPRMVFSHLMKLSRHHLTKLQRDNKGAAISIEREIQEIVGKIDPVSGFPAMLDLEGQAYFALGYYHQKAHASERIRQHRANT